MDSLFNDMTEQEYKEKLQVREQLSQGDRLRLLEYEFDLLLTGAPSEAIKAMGIIREPKKT